jgi:uncharacterized MnhB-related membrane protein
MLFLSAFMALWFRDLLHSIIALGVFSLILALEFYILRAPDVAIAEAAIGAALSTTIFIITLRACAPDTFNKGRGVKRDEEGKL